MTNEFFELGLSQFHDIACMHAFMLSGEGDED